MRRPPGSVCIVVIQHHEPLHAMIRVVDLNVGGKAQGGNYSPLLVHQRVREFATARKLLPLTNPAMRRSLSGNRLGVNAKCLSAKAFPLAQEAPHVM